MGSSFKLYAAGPIAGLTFDGASDWREYARQHLPPEIALYSPLRAKEYLRAHGVLGKHGYAENPLSLPKGVVGRDRFDVESADALLMNVFGATCISVGTVIEMGWADAYRKPVVLVMEGEGNPHEHIMFAEMATYRTDSLDHALHMVQALLLPRPLERIELPPLGGAFGIRQRGFVWEPGS